ncbi:MAG: hypothetical protein HY822_19365 [Acidobacteria bacterium]|nr:hypothetical protein [Acidobacteriota bacterium]
MAQVGSVGVHKLAGMLAGDDGLPSSVAAIGEAAGVRLQPIGTAQIATQNVTAELAERSEIVRYPSVHVYCEKLSNRFREKFRTFSGQAHLVLEIRVSLDRLEGLEQQVQLYADAVTRVLEQRRGDWGGGLFYGGGYEVVFGAAKRGGKNYLQTATITLDVDVSIQ